MGENKTASREPRHVTHPERPGQTGTVIRDDRRKAWTPDDLTADAPDAGMVRVRWSDSFDPQALFWEYERELVAQD
ncbi:Uncharacterised protein (plasmid) [Tsukamurella tyrosinosolvens]|uniref:Uncharacterized protein n=1 Tax=Tsukamurella tyrosinosolvens TaxID=57704 RepID=A0A1H4VLM5_TSUTY|nr:hypothetical protein [Tsukamurella tyrosinosolvens]KXO90952.1 hypothetical protein AXK58_21195 [Tsukamurella tyrosinosolvens]SEC81478.1 hypothetical protein SAMN04489793_3257 [Tsukamurella tyrosinosolvens]VEH90459.1 Uncharacterised protein [Tsukamurella tyrosinosolvens]